MDFSAELREYAERSESLLEESPQMDEENTKRKIIEPLLDLLGWKILTSDVELEYSVQMGSGTKKVDYALKIEDAPVVFVEAKGADTTLTENHQRQLTSYLRQVGVDWGLLTNGREFEIFRRDQSSSRPNEISLAEFALEDIHQNGQPLSALTKSSIESGEARQIAEKIESVQKAVGKLHSNKEHIAEEVTRIVTEEVGEAVSQRVEDEAKTFVDSLIESLGEQAHKSRRERRGNTADSELSGEYEIRVLDDGVEIDQVTADTQSKAVAALVEYLNKEHGLLNHIDIPHLPGTGRGTRALINNEPKHTNGEMMRMYEEIDGGYYVFTALSSQDKARYFLELPKKVGLEAEFVGW